MATPISTSDEPSQDQTTLSETDTAHLKSLETEQIPIEDEQPDKSEKPDLPLSEEEEKERVLRKVLGDKYKQDGAE